MIASSQPIIADYFGIFDTDWSAVLRPDTPFNKLNRVYISFGKIIQVANNHFSVAIDGDPNRVTQVVNAVKQMNPTAELFLTTGGDNAPDSYGGASADPSFGPNVISVLNQFGLHGFDMDWEQGLVTKPLNNLLINMSNAFRPGGYKLTLDVWPFSQPAYDYAVMEKTLDQMNIMSYGPGTPLNLSAAPFLNGGIPSYKLVGGIEVESGYAGGPDTTGIDGSIAAKAAYSLSSNFGGMMSWRLDNDYCPPGSDMPSYIGGIDLWDDMTTFQKDSRAMRAALRAAKKNYEILLSKYDYDETKVINPEKIMEARSQSLKHYENLSSQRKGSPKSIC